MILYFNSDVTADESRSGTDQWLPVVKIANGKCLYYVSINPLRGGHGKNYQIRWTQWRINNGTFACCGGALLTGYVSVNVDTAWNVYSGKPVLKVEGTNLATLILASLRFCSCPSLDCLWSSLQLFSSLHKSSWVVGVPRVTETSFSRQQSSRRVAPKVLVRYTRANMVTRNFFIRYPAAKLHIVSCISARQFNIPFGFIISLTFCNSLNYINKIELCLFEAVWRKKRQLETYFAQIDLDLFRKSNGNGWKYGNRGFWLNGGENKKAGKSGFSYKVILLLLLFYFIGVFFYQIRGGLNNVFVINPW